MVYFSLEVTIMKETEGKHSKLEQESGIEAEAEEKSDLFIAHPGLLNLLAYKNQITDPSTPIISQENVPWAYL